MTSNTHLGSHVFQVINIWTIPINSVHCTVGPSTHLGSHVFQVINIWTIPINSVHRTVGPSTHLGSHVFQIINIWSTYNKQCTLHCWFKYTPSVTYVFLSYLRSQLKLIIQYLNNRQTQVRHRRT